MHNVLVALQACRHFIPERVRLAVQLTRWLRLSQPLTDGAGILAPAVQLSQIWCTAVKWLLNPRKSPRLSDVERSVILRSVFAISTTLAYLLFTAIQKERATPPHVQVRHTT